MIKMKHAFDPFSTWINPEYVVSIREAYDTTANKYTLRIELETQTTIVVIDDPKSREALGLDK